MGKTTHGFSKPGGKPHPLYRVWSSMKTRCYNKKHGSYKDYGGRGITVCERWREAFENFRDDMLVGHEEGLQLDRINNDGNYSPSNCRWATVSVNAKNKRNRLEQQSIYPGISYSKKSKKWLVTHKFSTQSEAEIFAQSIKERL